MNYNQINERNDCIFVENCDDIGDVFILFNKSCAIIGNTQIADGAYITFNISENNNLNIYKNKESFAHFFSHYYYNTGIYELLASDDYDKFRFNITYENIYDKVKLYIKLYINKYYLLELYDNPSIPKLIYLIINNKNKILEVNDEVIKDIFEICASLNEKIETISCEKYLDLKLYNYQKNNVIWMTEIENKIDNKLSFIEYIDKKNYQSYHIKSIDEYICFNDERRILNLDKNKFKLNINGGLLCDEVGLGKTLSMISLIMNNPKNNYKYPLMKDNPGIVLNDNKMESNATIIFCPNRLCSQWYEEIQKYISKYLLKIIKITTIAQYRKYKLEHYTNCDIVLINFNFLKNPRYLDIEESPIRLEDILWHRIIVDEGHELLTTIRLNKNPNKCRETLYKFKSTHKWIVSGTPFPHRYSSLFGMINFLSDEKIACKDILYDKEISLIYNNHLRKNTRESIKDEIVIPPIKMETIFLKQTTIEKAIYNSANNDNLAKLQLCTHLLISEYDKLIDNDDTTLDKVQQIMSKHFNMKVNKNINIISNLNNTIKKEKIKILRRLDNISEDVNYEYYKVIPCMTPRLIERYYKVLLSFKLNTIINHFEKKIMKYNIELKEYQFKKNIFDELENKYGEIQNELCPISYCEMIVPCITNCGHIFDRDSIVECLKHSNKCPICRTSLTNKDYYTMKKKEEVSEEELTSINRYGTKMAYLINDVNKIIEEDTNNRIIIFSQWDKMLKLVGNVLKENNIMFVNIKGNANVMANTIRKFKLDKNIKIILLSSESCSSGSNLTEASHIILLDLLNENKDHSKAIENQAIGRANRIGQTKNVIVKKYIMNNTIEHEYYLRNLNN